jgi:acetolactate synthase-1/2/3 large subunit
MPDVPSRSALSGAELLIETLRELGVEFVFGYPGGAVLPIYDALFKQGGIRHILVRQEGGAVHAAEGYARSTGKPGVVLVTSGPGATNAVTGIADAWLDSIPLVVITGQVPTGLIGTDAFQECDTIGITRHCTKHNYLLKDPADVADVVRGAFHLATSGRPGPVVVDFPKDVQVASGGRPSPATMSHRGYRPPYEPDSEAIDAAVHMLADAKRPVIYSGGGVINAGPRASEALRQLAALSGAPVTSTLMGLGAFPASSPQWLGMLGMHGTYEANMAMNRADMLLCVGARFDDRVTGRLDAFAPHSRKVHIDIDRSSVNKNVRIDLAVIADAGRALEEMVARWHQRNVPPVDLTPWREQIDKWRARDCLAISGGLGTMGYGLPAAIGAQLGAPDALVIDIAGEASIQMNIQEMSTAVQYRLPVKVFILNNEYMGMVRQWQELNYSSRYAESYSAALPDFVALAEAYGWKGIRIASPDQLDEGIAAMLAHDGPVMVDCRVAKLANCFPMILSGGAHTEMILQDGEVSGELSDEGKALV